MVHPQRDLDQLLSEIERRESIAKRRALLWTLVPVAAAVVLLGYSSWRLSDESARVERLQGEVETLRRDIGVLEAKLKETQALLEDTVALAKYRQTVSFVDLKAIYSRYPRQARILDHIFNLREEGVRWRLGGQHPAEGFDSPSFAAYVLREAGLPGGDTVPGESLLESSRKLYERLPPTASPRVGDLVFYPAGYALFYFEDESRRPFVIGMTPAGIAALKPDFAERVGVRRVFP
jgi:cell division protein FtsB